MDNSEAKVKIEPPNHNENSNKNNKMSDSEESVSSGETSASEAIRSVLEVTTYFFTPGINRREQCVSFLLDRITTVVGNLIGW